MDFYFSSNELDVRWYMLMLLPLVIAMNLIRNLKYLAPFSMIANFLVGICMTITFWYVFQDLHASKSVPWVADWHKWPMFFGTAIFALEGIGVVSWLTNIMTYIIICIGDVSKIAYYFLFLHNIYNFCLLCTRILTIIEIISLIYNP